LAALSHPQRQATRPASRRRWRILRSLFPPPLPMRRSDWRRQPREPPREQRCCQSKPRAQPARLGRPRSPRAAPLSRWAHGRQPAPWMGPAVKTTSTASNANWTAGVRAALRSQPGFRVPMQLRPAQVRLGPASLRLPAQPQRAWPLQAACWLSWPRAAAGSTWPPGVVGPDRAHLHAAFRPSADSTTCKTCTETGESAERTSSGVPTGGGSFMTTKNSPPSPSRTSSARAITTPA